MVPASVQAEAQWYHDHGVDTMTPDEFADFEWVLHRWCDKYHRDPWWPLGYLDEDDAPEDAAAFAAAHADLEASLKAGPQ